MGLKKLCRGQRLEAIVSNCFHCVVVVKNIEYRTIKNLVIIIEVEKGTFKILCSWSFLGFSSRVQRSNGVVLYTFYTAQAF